MRWKKLIKEKPKQGQGVVYLQKKDDGTLHTWIAELIKPDEEYYWYLKEIFCKNECKETDMWIEIPKMDVN